MSEARLDQIVKGTPPPNVSLPSVAAAAASASIAEARERSSPVESTYPLPSDTSQICLNLLILEASLRSQYLTLRARRRQNTFVLIVLSFWILYFVWCQFLRPRKDGKVGGSEYWLVDMIEKVALLSGLVMGLLFRFTGQWARGITWPAKWLRTTNRGLHTMNCKVVVVKGPWWREGLSHLSSLFPLGSLVENPGLNYRYVEYSSNESKSVALGSRHRHSQRESIQVAEEDIAVGGNYIKILLLPKHFTLQFREKWEAYRAAYWDQENRRRKELRSRSRIKQRQIAKQQNPWFWWLTGRRLLVRLPIPTIIQGEKGALVPSSNQRNKRMSNVVRDKELTHSRSSSRSSAFSAGYEEEREQRWAKKPGASGERKQRKAAASLSSDAERPSCLYSRTTLISETRRRLSTSASEASPRTKSSKLNSHSYATLSSSEGDSPIRKT